MTIDSKRKKRKLEQKEILRRIQGVSKAMKSFAIFVPPINEYIAYHIIKYTRLKFLLAFKPVYFFLHLFYH